MMFSYAVVNTEGKIVSVYRGSKQFLPCPDHVTDLDHFYSFGDERFVEKRLLQISVDVAGLSATLSGVPQFSVIEVVGHEMATESGEVELEFDAPGTYEIHIYPPPQYRDEVLEVTIG